MEKTKIKYEVDHFPPSRLERDPVTGNFKDVAGRGRELYSLNCFMMDFFHVNIDEVHCGSCQVSLKIEHDKHANHRNVVHGGVLTALCDSVLGVTGATVGEKVVTVSFSMNFVRNIEFGDTARVISHIKSYQEKSMVIAAEMYDSENRLMATLLATMFNMGRFEGIPRQW